MTRLPDGLLLARDERGRLTLRSAGAPASKGLCIDFSHLDLRTGSGGLSKKQPLARAMGRGARTVLDATAGLGQDAVLLACMGWRVTAVERSPIIAELLEDGLRRAEEDLKLKAALGGRLELVEGDSRRMLLRMSEPPDVVYMDPMFPPRRKKSALAKIEIRILRDVVGDDEDAAGLLAAARKTAARRVVVKRPDHAPPLAPKPSLQVEGKLVRYDVYLSERGQGLE